MKKILLAVVLLISSTVAFAATAVYIGPNSDNSAEVYYDRDSLSFKGSEISLLVIQKFYKPNDINKSTANYQILTVSINCNKNEYFVNQFAAVDANGKVLFTETINRNYPLNKGGPLDKLRGQFCR